MTRIEIVFVENSNPNEPSRDAGRIELPGRVVFVRPANRKRYHSGYRMCAHCGTYGHRNGEITVDGLEFFCEVESDPRQAEPWKAPGTEL